MTDASVISTGGGGTVFEQHVGGSFLTLLLVGGYLPITVSARPVCVHFQAKRLGWQTDDFAIEGQDPNGQRHLLAIQVKRSFSISATDADCVKVFAAAWADFNNGALFNQNADALVLIVHIGSNRLLSDFGWLLTQLRVSPSAEEFANRLAGEGLLNKRSKADYETIKTILKTIAAQEIPDASLWSFLRSFHILSYDFTATPSKDEAMVRSMLSLVLANPQDMQLTASTWGEMVTVAGQSAATGKSVRRENLPDEILARHGRVGSVQHSSLAKLREHSDVVLSRISDTTAKTLSFPRRSLAEELERNAQAQIVFIVGSAGSGKSALAKRHIQSIATQNFCFVFAAEEFRAPHIDQVLLAAQIGVNWVTLRSLLALQNRKTILIEGLERLLESDNRTALTDLLTAVSEDRTLQVIITCRDYHAETVERTMLRPSGASFQRVVVPDLSDEELTYASEQIPTLRVPLAVPALRRLLKNPFMLAQAAEIYWAPDQALPVTERALRERFWADVVRVDKHPHAALPVRRAASLKTIALDRARSLRPHVEQSEGDHEAIGALALDNLIVFDSPSRLRMAPAHDVFEDWALIELLTEEFAAKDGDNAQFANARQPYPALRRAYRKWLVELIESEPAVANGYLTDVVATSVPEYLRDDTFIAIFQSASSVEFLGRFASEFLTDNARWLSRAMHIIRVACKTVSPLVPVQADLTRVWHVPAGSAWSHMLAFLRSKWEQIPASLYPLILGFVEDWASGVSWVSPYPDGAGDAGYILEKLLPHATVGYRGKSEKERVLTVLLQIPKVVESTFKGLVERAKLYRRSSDDDEAELVAELLPKLNHSLAASRDYPAEVIDLCWALWKVKTEDSEDYHHSSSMSEIESAFGLADPAHHDFFPASALQGPFRHLLLMHPVEGIRFIVSLVNYAADCYGEQHARMQFVEPPVRVILTALNGRERTLWSNSRLWNAYRATTVMPHLIESALMAFEAWALQNLANAGPHEGLLIVLEWALNNSNNVSPIAALTAVCNAYPVATAQIGVKLLGCREFFELDRQRMGAESHALAVGGMGFEKQTLQRERLDSNKLPHRKRDLEHLARNLQLGSGAAQVHEFIDQYRRALPPLDQQDDADRLWRLSLARMDLRAFEPVGRGQDGMVQWQMQAPEPDIQEMIEQAAPSQERFLRHVALFMWATHQFEKKAEYAEESAQWRDRLMEARAVLADATLTSEEIVILRGGPAIVVAVCIRDHWDEMLPADRAWSEDTVLQHVLARADEVDSVQAKISNPIDGVQAYARVVPLIRLRSDKSKKVGRALIAGLLHYNDGVRSSTLAGVSEFIVGVNDELAAFCARVLLTATARKKAIHEAEEKTPYDRRKSYTAKIADVLAYVTKSVSDRWYSDAPNFGHIGPDEWWDHELSRDLILLYKGHPRVASAVEWFAHVAELIRSWWGRRRSRRDDRPRRDYELEASAEQTFAEFLVSSEEVAAIALITPLLDAASTAPDELGGLVSKLLTAEDGRTTESSYWPVWRAITERIRNEAWVNAIDKEYAKGRDLLRASFLNTLWKQGVRSWPRLGNNFADVDRHYSGLPATAFALTSYCHYLYHIGESSLPGALILISDKCGESLIEKLSADTTTGWYLESVISRLMFQDLAALKATGRLRQALLNILDALVQVGSSIAFRLRDDFVTPTAYSRNPS